MMERRFCCIIIIIILKNYLVQNEFVEEENESVSFQFVCAL